MFSATVSVSNSEKCWNTIADAELSRGAPGWRCARARLPSGSSPASGLDDAVDDLHQRGLAGAVFAEHRVDLAGQHVEVDVVVGDDAGVSLGDAAEREARRARARFTGIREIRHAADYPGRRPVSRNQ